MTEQLEFGTVPESTPLRLGFVIDFSKFLSRQKREKKVRLPEQEKGKRKKTGVDMLGAILTTTRDFFTPEMTSLERYGSPSGYNTVVSLWNPGASITTCR